MSCLSWETSPAWSAHLYWKQQPTISQFSRCLWSALVPPVFVRSSHVIKCLFIIHCKSRQVVILSACVLNPGGPHSSQVYTFLVCFAMYLLHSRPISWIIFRFFLPQLLLSTLILKDIYADIYTIYTTQQYAQVSCCWYKRHLGLYQH